MISNKRSWTEIDLEQIVRNYETYKYHVPQGVEVMIVVKADAYGHGDVEISKKLEANGIHNFAVSNIEEATRLRKAGINGQILILGYTPPDRAEDLFKNDITQTLVSNQYAEALLKYNYSIKCQFAIDTGMRRIGLNADNIQKCEESIRRIHQSKLNLTGFFTHLCVADTPSEKKFTEHQIELFDTLVERVKDLNLPYTHCLNSAGGLWHISPKSCFARLGIVLYGLKPDYENILPEGIQPALTWKTVVSMVKSIHRGDTVGYGRSFTAENDMIIATLPTGYADGYSRLLSNKGYVLVNGKKAAIIGRVCMDQMMVNVTEIPEVEMGTEVTLIGKNGCEVLTADDLAKMIGTIGYEIVCGISKRVERCYV